MRFFTTLEKILTASDPREKIASFHAFYEAFLAGETAFEEDHTPEIFTTPSFASFCTIVPATTLPKRKSLSTPKGKAYLVHSIAHIEYSAIDLALDHCYRFKGMPEAYYHDWLEVAEEEVRHFQMLEEILKKLGYAYGDFPVHRFLFDISQKTLNIVDRMAVVPRYLEASGLDASPQVIEKLKRIDDFLSREIIQALEVILEEEIDHVRKGDRWYRWACEKQKRDPAEYYTIVSRYLPGATKEKHYVNVKSRKKAGFSCDEIRVISSQPCEE